MNRPSPVPAVPCGSENAAQPLAEWIVDQLMAISLADLGSLHATVYLPSWKRALGARLGRFVEDHHGRSQSSAA